MKILRIITLPLLAAQFVGCAAQRPLEMTFDPCHRAEIAPAPIWTASAAWTPEEDHVMLIGPERHSILIYNLQGELEREIALDPLAELEYASPVRLQETHDGYLIGDKTQLLWLDRDFRKRRLWKPFEHLKKAGIAAGNLSDFAVVGHTVYAFADFVWDDGEAPAPRKKAEVTDPYDHRVSGVDEPPGGNWFRGFAKIDLERPELVSLQRFGLEDNELSSYYFYGTRPYVADLGKRAYVLRYTDPPQVFRSSRKTLEPLYSARDDDDFEIGSVLAWKGRLFLSGTRRVEADDSAKNATEPIAPSLVANPNAAKAQLLALQQARPEAETQRLLIEIDPKSGETLGTYRLPTTGGNMKLVPGSSYWAMIEESAVNLKPEDKVRLTLLPASWLDSPGAGPRQEKVLECPAG